MFSECRSCRLSWRCRRSSAFKIVLICASPKSRYLRTSPAKRHLTVGAADRSVVQTISRQFVCFAGCFSLRASAATSSSMVLSLARSRNCPRSTTASICAMFAMLRRGSARTMSRSASFPSATAPKSFSCPRAVPASNVAARIASDGLSRP
jgi:hypothetical protein